MKNTRIDIPAFPSSDTDTDVGMSLRDYFASQALVCFSSRKILLAIRSEAAANGIEVPDAIACAVYELADAMLRERKR